MEFLVDIGVDIIKIDRFRENSIQNKPQFYKSIFSDSEIARCGKYSDSFRHFAGIFAAKEAVKKCWENPLAMKDIEITWEKTGKPNAVIIPYKKKAKVSISYSEEYAIAIAYTLN